MNTRILDLFIKENSAWEDMISRQIKEIPLIDRMITCFIEEKKVLKDDMAEIFRHLRKEIFQQEKRMVEVTVELEKQQQYLVSEIKRKIADPQTIDAFFSQKLLRERIQEVEKSFVELKCKYLNYIVTI